MPKSYDYNTFKRAMNFRYKRDLTLDQVSKIMEVPRLTIIRWTKDLEDLKEAVDNSTIDK